MKQPDVEDIYELSPLQMGMLYHALDAPGDGMYFEQVTLPFEGHLDAVALRKAWTQALANHSILRTSFHWEDLKKPMQVVRPSVELPYQELDWADVSESARSERLAHFLGEDRKNGFDLESAPLLRVTVLHYSSVSHVVVWSFHHILLDGWSAMAVLKQVSADYVSLASGNPAAAISVKPFSEYIEWLRAQDDRRADEYWRRQLNGFATPTKLGVDRFTGQSGFDSAESELPAGLCRALEDFSRRNQITLGTIFQGAWALLLSRYSGEEDVVYGTVVSGRPPSIDGVENMIGLFINTLPVRVRADSSQSLRLWLKALQEQLAEMRNYEFSQLAQVQTCSDVPRGTPLFQSLAAYENYAGSGQGGEGSREAQIIERTNYPLTFMAAPGERTILKALYFRSLFSERSIEALLRHVQLILEQIVADPDAPLSNLSLVTTEERKRILDVWNATSTPYPSEKSLHQLFEEAAKERPDDVALAFNDETVAYGVLNERANRIARYLLAEGLQRGGAVGLAMDRSIELIAAMLGTLKAGGCYVPIDRSYPDERIRFMVEDAQLKFLLVPDRGDRAFDDSASKVLVLDEAALARHEQTNPELAIGPDDLAYVMYTSGSTGRPKGTEVTHRNVVRLVRGADYIDFGSDLSWLQLASVSFDASTLEIWGSLLNGARLTLAPLGDLTLDRLGEILRSKKITALWLTAGLFHQMVDDQLASLSGLKYLLTGGDVVSPEQARRVREAFPEVRLLNGYGPTENTTFSTVHAIEETWDAPMDLPIGTPISNSTVYVLDPCGNLLPPGVPGEIHVGGDGVARGYRNRSELTDERFVPDPFSAKDGARLYRTGDVGRFREDGVVEFLGRKDNQVKVRGYRVELGEVEACLAGHPRVASAAAAIHEFGEGDRRVCAYYVSDGAAPPTQEGLREHARERLPDYCMPAFLTEVDALPLTPNGKVDRAALPKPHLAEAANASDVDEPRGEIEEALSDIWAEVLKIERPSVQAHFFNDYGGHSLLATQLVSRIRSRFEIDVQLREFFGNPTIAGLAALVEDILLAEIDDFEDEPLEAELELQTR